MAVISNRFEENGKKVIQLESNSVMLNDLFWNAVKIANKKCADEYRLSVNGCNLVFDGNVTIHSIWKDYKEYLDSRFSG